MEIPSSPTRRYVSFNPSSPPVPSLEKRPQESVWRAMQAAAGMFFTPLWSPVCPSQVPLCSIPCVRLPSSTPTQPTALPPVSRQQPSFPPSLRPSHVPSSFPSPTRKSSTASPLKPPSLHSLPPSLPPSHPNHIPKKATTLRHLDQPGRPSPGRHRLSRQDLSQQPWPRWRRRNSSSSSSSSSSDTSSNNTRKRRRRRRVDSFLYLSE